MDTIPYSRVFYHAFPGAIIMHRGKRYKIHTMNYPPCTGTSSQRINCSTLCAFAKPSNDRFTTRALSTTLITVVRQIQSVDLDRTNIQNDHSNHLRFEDWNLSLPPLSHFPLPSKLICNKAVIGHEHTSSVSFIVHERKPNQGKDFNNLTFDIFTLILISYFFS